MPQVSSEPRVVLSDSDLPSSVDSWDGNTTVGSSSLDQSHGPSKKHSSIPSSVAYDEERPGLTPDVEGWRKISDYNPHPQTAYHDYGSVPQRILEDLHASDHLPPLAYTSTQSRTPDAESQPLLGVTKIRKNNSKRWAMFIFAMMTLFALVIIACLGPDTPRDDLDLINRKIVAANDTLNHLHDQMKQKQIDLEHWTLQVQIASDDHASLCAQIEHRKTIWEEEQRQHNREFEEERRHMDHVRKEWDEERQEHDHELEKERKRVEDWRREDEARYRREREEKEKQEEEERQRRDLYWDRVEESPLCASYGTREYTAHLSNLPSDYDGLKGCRETAVEIHGVTIERPERCEDRGSMGIYGHWMVDFGEPSCQTYWGSFNDKGCTAPGSRRRHIESQLQGLPYAGEDWHKMCDSTPADFQGMHFDRPDSCDKWRLYGVWGFWFIDDPTC